MKVGKNFTVKKLGHGCSRKVYLLDSGDVVKFPRYNNSWNYLGSPEKDVLKELIEEFKDDKRIAKVLKLKEKKGLKIPYPCLGTLAEYLVSLKVKGTNDEELLAVCKDIKVRKRRDKNEISIIGIYENALTKEERTSNSDIEINLAIGDLHQNNFVNGYIVDYAALE